jgi:hypothetical protein
MAIKKTRAAKCRPCIAALAAVGFGLRFDYWIE